MKLLQEKILKDGKVLPNDILKIDSFINHQIEYDIMDEIGKEFARLFSDVKPDKILTIEASGNVIAYSTSLHMDKQPVVFAKKSEAANMDNDAYVTKERSYTRMMDYTVKVAKEYLNKGDKILIIDDFLANGEALNALLDICKQAEAEVLGCGIVVAKMYQVGYERIKKICPRIEILAKVKSMNDKGEICFED